MRHAVSHEWRSRLSRQPFRASVGMEQRGLVLGRGTLLLAAEEGARTITLNRDAAHDRLVALLAVAAGGRLAKDSVPHIGVALDAWRRGDKALAAIRLAYARLPRLAEVDDAYPLFLAETALDIGLTPHELLRELGYGPLRALLKGSPDQPRVPKGSGRTSGQYTSDGTPAPFDDGPTRDAHVASDARIIPVFLDTQQYDAKERQEEHILGTHPFDGAHPLEPPLVEGFPLPLPFLVPAPKAGDDDKDGPACPAMRPDRPNGANAAGDTEEARVARLINPEEPTPKASPANPDVTSMAYYFPVPSPTGEIAIDDCKRTSAPIASIPDIRKGDTVEVKTEGAADMIRIGVPQAVKNYDEQFRRQVESLLLDDKGRRLFTCVGSEINASFFTKKYLKRQDNAYFIVCP